MGADNHSRLSAVQRIENELCHKDAINTSASSEKAKAFGDCTDEDTAALFDGTHIGEDPNTPQNASSIEFFRRL
jgi:hypothetical protein